MKVWIKNQSISRERYTLYNFTDQSKANVMFMIMLSNVSNMYDNHVISIKCFFMIVITLNDSSYLKTLLTEITEIGGRLGRSSV